MVKSIRALFQSFHTAASGNVTVIFAFSLPLVAGGAAFGVEVGGWFYDQVRLQQMADAAAVAAAIENRAGNPPAVMLTAATTAATDNGFNAATDTLTLNTPPVSGSYQNTNSSEVLLARNETRLFTALFNQGTVTVRARAVSTYTTAANACVIALDPGASQAVTFSGSSTVKLVGCNVMSDSISTQSIYSQGATTVQVPCLMTAGNVSINAAVSETSCTSPMTQLPPIADPFRNVSEPSVTGSCQSINGKGSTIQPGRYCGGLSINGATTFKPGVYIIDGGAFKLNGGATISGDGVMIYLANNATVSINGNAKLTLTPPTSGAWSGILFFGSRSNASSNSVTVNGTADSSLTGAIYFPKQPVSYTGDFAGANGCTQVIARTVSWSGNSNLAVDCSAYGMSPLPVGGAVKLAE